MIGSTNLSGGGGVGSDELTATAANVLEETTYVGADTDDELAEGTMQHLSSRATITHTTENATKVIEGDAAFTSINSDGTARAEIRYNGTEGFITPNTLFAVPQGDMATAGGLTAGKLLQGQSAFGIAGTATSDATAAANQISSGKIAYVKGSKVTGTLVERGQSQYGGFGSGSGYIAINALPEGIYRSNGASWAPEARIATSTLASGIGLNASVIKKGVSILGITGSCEGYFSSPFYLFNNGSWNGLSSTGMSMVDNLNNRNSLSIDTNINLTIYLKSNHGCSMRTNASFDFTNYRYLNFVVSDLSIRGGWISITRLGISNSSNTRNLTASINPSSGTCIVNVSSISGWYYIYIVVNPGGTSSDASGNMHMKISQIYVSN